jgi:hypothetical protein
MQRPFLNIVGWEEIGDETPQAPALVKPEPEPKAKSKSTDDDMDDSIPF